MADSPFSYLNQILLNNVSVSSNQTSNVINISEAGCYAVNAYWSGSSPSGTFEIQGSNGSPGNIVPSSSDPSWVTVSSTSVSGNTGSLLVNIEHAAYFYLQVVYVATSGTGNITATLAAKRV